MTPMRFHSTKYDGSLHYLFEVEVVHQEPHLLAVYTPVGTPLQSYRGEFPARHHMLGLYFADRPWNLLVSWHADWSPRHHYVNIATPAAWSDGVLRCCDLDLDLIRRPDERRVVLDDADEFDRHRARWGYPDDLVATCCRTAVHVAALMERPDPLFDGRLFAWRPGAPLPALQGEPAVGR